MVHLLLDGWMVGRMDGQMDGWMDGWMDGQMDEKCVYLTCPGL